MYRDPIDYLKLRYSMLKDREDKKTLQDVSDSEETCAERTI